MIIYSKRHYDRLIRTGRITTKRRENIKALTLLALFFILLTLVQG